LYSIYQANLLKRQYEKDNNFTYDIVVCTRYDFKLLKPMLFDWVTVDKPGIYHPGGSPFNVCCAMGDSTSANQYAELYLNYDMIYRMGTTWVDEFLAKDYLNYNGIEVYDMHIPNGLNRMSD
jgi:hypothetical protein